MKDIAMMYAKYAREKDKTVVSLLDKLSHEEREKDRGSYYGSLSGLVRHLAGTVIYFHGLFKGSLQGTSADPKALSAVEMLSFPKGKLTEEHWKSLKKHIESVNQATINFVSGLSDRDFSLPIRIDWYGGDPDTVPLFFLFHQMAVHGIHHRGQISQILDELKVEHDFSGIDLDSMPPV